MLSRHAYCKPMVSNGGRAPHDHYSLLAAVEDRLGLPRLGWAVRANEMTDVLGG